MPIMTFCHRHKGKLELPLFLVLPFWNLKSNCLLWTVYLLQGQGRLLRLAEQNNLRNASFPKSYVLGRSQPIYMLMLRERRRRERRKFGQIEAIICENTLKLVMWNLLFWDPETINELIILRYFSEAHIHYEYSLPYRLPYSCVCTVNRHAHVQICSWCDRT